MRNGGTWKRRLTTLLCALLMMTLPGVSAWAAKIERAGEVLSGSGTPTISIDSVSVEPGKTAEIPVRISGNPGIAGLALTFSLPEDVVLNEVTVGEKFSKGTFMAGEDSVTWFDQDNNTANDILFKLKVMAPSKAGEYAISAFLKDNKPSNAADENGDTVAVTFLAGKLVVKNSTTSISNAMVTEIFDKKYNGSAQTQNPTVKVGDKTLVNGTDYTLSYENNTNAGTATVTITGKNSYKDSIKKNFKINPASLAGATVDGITNKTYTGVAQTQNLTVKLGEKTLVLNTDYTVGYANNVNAGTATVTVTGKGNYNNTVRKNFTISPASLAGATVDGITNKTYTGAAQTQNLTVKLGEKTLVLNTDYTVGYANNINVGTATVTVTGKGNYNNTVSKNFTISPASISGATISGVVDKIFNGTAQTQSVTVKLGEKTLTANTDYTVTYANNTNVGAATVTVTGKNNYKDSASKNFAINPESASGVTVTGIVDKTYTGAVQTQNLTVKLGEKTLVLNTDYTVGYANNINAGTATVTVTGKGNYNGTVSKYFTISPASLAGATVDGITNKTYTGAAQTQNLTVKLGEKTLVLNTDYTVGYANNINAGTATVTVTGKGNYNNTVSKNFTISPASISGATISGVVDKIFNGTAQTQNVTVKLGEKTLTVNTDYTVTYANNTNVGTATVTVTGKNNYKDSASKNFAINPESASGVTVTGIVDKNYTGEAQTQNLTVKIGEKTLAINTDYTVSYNNNINAGTAMVNITGKGNYKFTISKTFTIHPASLAGATVSGITNKTFTGAALTQNLTVRLGEKTLTPGADYTVGYTNNTNAGTTTITITGKGNCCGSITISFTISPASITGATVNGIVNKTFTGTAQTQTPSVIWNGKTLENDKDYTLSYANNVNVGTATVTITGKGNFTGKIDKSFTIANKTYKVTYNMNGGEDSIPDQVKVHDQELILSATKPTFAGNEFLGWNTDPKATTAIYQPSDKYKANADATLYAIWNLSTYTVSYNMNGGYGTVENQIKTYGVDLKLNETKPQRTNYVFVGWGTSKASTTAQYQPGDPYKENNNITLYAVWAPEEGSEMKTGYDGTLPDGDYIIASAADVRCYLDIDGSAYPAVRGTNVFLWRKDWTTGNELDLCDIWSLKYENGFYRISQAGQEISLDVQSSSTKNGENVHVWANNSTSAQKWAISRHPKGGYRIQSKCSGCSLDINGAHFTQGANIQQWISNNTEAQAWVFIPYVPTQPLENGRFVLLSDMDKSLELDIDENTGENVQIWEDACPSRDNSFDIVALDNGYYYLTNVATGKVLECAEEANVYISEKNDGVAQQWAITQVGDAYVLRCRANGFCLEVEGSKRTNSTNVDARVYEGEKSQSNQAWHLVPAEYEVTYNANGGEEAPASQTKYYKEALPLSQEISREGYIFKEWNTKADGQGTAYAAGENYLLDSDTELYAIWEEDVPAEIPVEAVVLQQTTAKLQVGKKLQLSATVSPNDAADPSLTWKSSDTSVVTVSENGLVTANAVGKARISAVASNGVMAVCEVTVNTNYIYRCSKNGIYRYTLKKSLVKQLKAQGWTYKKAFLVPGASTVKVYEVYNKKMGCYRYTTDLNYAKKMKAAGHKASAVFYSSLEHFDPVYEFSKGTKNVTYYYANYAEKASLLKKGWKEVGIAWYSQPTVSIRYVYRCSKNGVYRYTMAPETVKQYQNEGWTCKKAFRVPAYSTEKVSVVYNKSTKRYRLTTDQAYVKMMKDGGHKAWFGFYQSVDRSLPVYEFIKEGKNTNYFYTTNLADKETLIKNGWKEVGIAWYALPKPE